jgi:DNA-binding IclR family transcriptional regulator
MMAPAKNHERYLVPGLERGLKLLSLFSRAEPELPLAELARRLGLSRSSVFRLAYTLEHTGFLLKGAQGYQVGPRVLTLGFDYLASQDLIETARPELTALRDATGASAHLGVREGVEVIYVAQVSSLRQLSSRVSVGTRFPAHAMSMGRLLLSALSDAELEALYRGVKLKRFTDETPASLAELKRRIAADRARGYVVSRGSFESGIAAVAAPVFDAQGKIVAAINISGPAAVLDAGALDGAIKDRVIQAAANISRKLGYRPREVA